MKMSKQLVTAYLMIQEKIKDQRKILHELKDEEKKIMNELRDYLNQTEEVGIRIDENTVITLTHNDKKINRTSKAYKAYLTDLCNERGLPDNEFVNAILNGKIETIVQQQKLKIIKIR
jgi:hypothetical protein